MILCSQCCNLLTSEGLRLELFGKRVIRALHPPPSNLSSWRTVSLLINGSLNCLQQPSIGLRKHTGAEPVESMAFRALTRCRALTSGTARRAPSRPIGSGTSSSRAKFFRSAHTGPQSKKSGRLIPLQLLVLGALPLFAGYLIGRSSTSGSAAEGQAKLSHVDFASRKEMIKVL